MSRLAQEAFKHVSTSDQRPTFLLTAFTVAAIPSIVLLVVRRRKVLPIELGFGFVMGASNILQTHFILKALQYYDGFVVFLVVSSGSLMLTTVVATRMLGERLTRRTQIGIATAIVALVLLNYLPQGNVEFKRPTSPRRSCGYLSPSFSRRVERQRGEDLRCRPLLADARLSQRESEGKQLDLDD